MILLGLFLCLLAFGLYTTTLLTNPYDEPETDITCVVLTIIGIVCIVVGLGTWIGLWDITIKNLINKNLL